MLAVLPGGMWVAMLGMAVLAALTLKQMAKLKQRGSGVDLGAKDGEGAKRDARDSMDALFLQLQEFSRDTLARLDTKVRVLNELLARAEGKIEELKRLSAAPAPVAPPPAGRPANPLHEKIHRLGAEGKSSTEIASSTGLERGEVEMILGLRGKGA